MNQKIGWGFGIINNSNICSNIHTINGGDTTFIVGLHQISTEVPKEFMLFQNYPNPFNPKTIIRYQITSKVKRETSNVKLIIFDITGREISILVNTEQQAGTYEVDWNAAGYSSGIYFYSLITDGILIETKKMLMVK